MVSLSELGLHKAAGDKIPSEYIPLVDAVTSFIEAAHPDVIVIRADNGDIVGPDEQTADQDELAKFPMLNYMDKSHRLVLCGEPIRSLVLEARNVFLEAMRSGAFIIEIASQTTNQFYRLTEREVEYDYNYNYNGKLFLFTEVDANGFGNPLMKYNGHIPLVKEKAFRDWLSKKAPPSAADLTTKERHTLLVLLAAALTRGNPEKLAKLDKMAQELTSWTEQLGARVARRSVDDKLEQINEAIERCGKN